MHTLKLICSKFIVWKNKTTSSEVIASINEIKQANKDPVYKLPH